MSEISKVHIKVSGRVQGVWFRGWTVQEAKKLGLTGWVRNRYDGSVEIYIEGDSAKVSQMMALCHKGPPVARVTNIEPVRIPDYPLPDVEDGIFKTAPTY